MMKTIRTTLSLVTLVILLPTCGSTGASDNGGRTPSQVMSYRGADWLERSSRADEEQPERLLDLMSIESGDIVADIGAGTGYFSRPLARRVAPFGKVYAVDIQPQMLDRLSELSQRQNIDNIIPVLSDDDDPRLPMGQIDWVLLVDVYHEFQKPESMLAKIREALAPGGRVVLAEYRLKGNTARHIRRDHRMSVDQVLAEWEPAGFELVEIDESLPTQHLFIFRARERASGEDKEEI